ncbi:MAG: HNH endonuclease [Omnitrophica WOR_2 bacterium]
MSYRKRSAIYLSIVLLMSLVVVSCVPVSSSTPEGSPSGTTSSTGGSIGNRTKTSGCMSQDALPDPECTPGAIFPDATQDKICVPGYSSEVRNVPESEKNQVYAEYGIKTHTAGEYEVDHLISLELGGSNDIANLWPEPAEPRPGFHEKDKVENYLHKQVCDGAMSLQDAQYQIAHDWMAVYQNMPSN